MAIEMLDGESSEYRSARKDLLAEEMDLRQRRKDVAALRRELPPGPVMTDYVFSEGPEDLTKDGPIRQVRLSELFDDSDKPLVLYNFMYGAAQKTPCPMCSMWIDGWNGVNKHITQNSHFAIIAQAPVQDLRVWARNRGWHNLRLLSADGTTYKLDVKTADEEGAQFPAISVFKRGEDGAVRHFYTQGAMLPEEKPTGGGIDFLNPVWNLLDLLPAGRQDFFPKAEY